MEVACLRLRPDNFLTQSRRGIPLTHEQIFLRLLPRIRFVNECWLWTGARRGGQLRKEEARYGHVIVNGKSYYVHRLLYAIFRGPIPPGGVIDHTHSCQLGHCVNPSFLELTTAEQNNRRAAALTNCGDRYAYEVEW